MDLFGKVMSLLLNMLSRLVPRSVGAKYATGDQWRNNSRKNKETEPKQKQHPVVDGTGNGSNIQCCKEQYYNIAQEPGMLGL